KPVMGDANLPPAGCKIMSQPLRLSLQMNNPPGTPTTDHSWYRWSPRAKSIPDTPAQRPCGELQRTIATRWPNCLVTPVAYRPVNPPFQPFLHYTRLPGYLHRRNTPIQRMKSHACSDHRGRPSGLLRRRIPRG